MDSYHFEFCPMTESDLPLLTQWLNRPHLQQWWRREKVCLEEVQKKYLPRIIGKDAAIPFLACLDSNPVGYIQYYWTSAGDPDWWPDTPSPTVVGIDQFLADEHNLNRGIGTAMVSQFTEFLFKTLDITEIRTDPNPENRRAIRCYEKAGFKKISQITTPDGPALMMVIKKPNLHTVLLGINEILNRLDIPYQIAGGLAAKCYGSTRPLHDIDIYVSEEAIPKLEEELKTYIEFGPAHHKDEHWDLIFMKLNYNGWQIEFGDADHTRYFDSQTNRWIQKKIDFEESVEKEFEGIWLPVMPKHQLINYKQRLNRKVDQADIKEIRNN